MIFVIFSLISIIYIFYLYKNYGEKSQINLKNLRLVLPLFVITAGLIVVFQIDSGIHLKDEYSKLSERNMKIRENIKIIKNNIPILEEQVRNEPNNLRGNIMLGKSYMLINEFSQSAQFFKKAISMKSNDPDLLLDYIFVLKKIDAKKNKTEIINTYEKLIMTDYNDMNTYNMYLNYLFEINDVETTKLVLSKVIENPNIVNKDSYQKALDDLKKNTQITHMVKIKLSEDVISTLQQSKNVFFILRSDKQAPFAVKRMKSAQIVSEILISDNNIMINNTDQLPTEVTLLIKTSNEDFVSTEMKTVYQSDLISLKNSINTEILVDKILIN